MVKLLMVLKRYGFDSKNCGYWQLLGKPSNEKTINHLTI